MPVLLLCATVTASGSGAALVLIRVVIESRSLANLGHRQNCHRISASDVSTVLQGLQT